ncbi:hypothetical protein HMPREF0578_0825 [Mobiluncus mulieris 28-1]|uniref:Signal peptidase n=1 Tax=Mobiluncus mulieris TaxID=2052 RepID=A0A2J9KRY4_9ACTO|nr:hypothetical protein [Mobiluncus mulieris]EEZ91686.1 hypothetical protein HMPREF0578_0825 [Mobiluncus mulieris 28-1]EFN92644.1 hypothetical protein HMPREF9278_1925 [Mobiluncus mulieris FB024-16]MBB5846425.1 hypothetical protein [Mobiluncus mulieris]MCU9971676.1 signal peptidase [Mobiluncus mulieris]MCU9976226.1 signal peptidase [Mobiluncus mulieris]
MWGKVLMPSPPSRRSENGGTVLVVEVCFRRNPHRRRFFLQCFGIGFSGIEQEFDFGFMRRWRVFGCAEN